MQKIALISLALSLLVLGIKYLAYHLTGSVALYSDALESIVNVATAAAIIVALKIATLPPDDEHPYGHHKAEYLSAIVVGGLIMSAAFAIFQQAWNGFTNPQPIEAPWLGLAVSSIATALNIGWGLFLMRYGRKHKAASLVADGKHLMADVITSIGVIVGLSLVILTGITVLDSIIAALVALHVLINGWGIIKENSSGLLDETAPPEELALIRKTISENMHGAIEAHDLRTRHAGKMTFIEFHLIVTAHMPVGTAHELCDKLEQSLQALLTTAHTVIHVEPDSKAKHEDAIFPA